MAQIYVRPVYPPEDFAAAFGVSLAFVRREIREGRLPAFRIGRLLRIAGEDGLEWRDRYRITTADAEAGPAQAAA